jgi:hypothetical protein
MRTRTIFAPGSQLRRVQRHFELWRKTRKRCSPIPETLWVSAVELARKYGVHQTARALRLNYYSLKKRFPSIDGTKRGSQKKATFVELLPSGATGLSVCTIEMENTQGEKMKIQLQSLDTTGLSVLANGFWKVAS